MALAVFGFCFYSLFASKSPAFADYADEYELYLEAGSFGRNVVNADKNTYLLYRNMCGESCIVTVSYERVLKDYCARHVFSEETEYGVSRYAYSPKLPYSVCLNGVAVNIQYFEGKTANKLGTPMIYGSY